MSKQTSPTLTAEAASEKANESARRAERFVSEKVARAGDAAEKAGRAGDAAEKAGRAGRRVAHSVSEKLRSGASKGGRAALSKLTDAGIKLTGKQQEVLERLKSRVSD